MYCAGIKQTKTKQINNSRELPQSDKRCNNSAANIIQRNK